MMTADLNKTLLRALRKTHGIKGYANFTNDGMRKALAALKPAEKPKEKGKPADPNRAPSIKSWLAEQLSKGPLSVADAMAFAAATQRSRVSAHRQIRELGFRAVKGAIAR